MRGMIRKRKINLEIEVNDINKLYHLIACAITNPDFLHIEFANKLQGELNRKIKSVKEVSENE